jgi:hypothetical protein
LPADPEQQATAIVPTPVMPLVSPDKAAEQWKLFDGVETASAANQVSKSRLHRNPGS